MNKLKQIIIVLIALLVILGLIVTILLNKQKKETNNYEYLNEEKIHQEAMQEILNAGFKEVTDNKTYFNVKHILDSYIVYVKQVNGDTYADNEKINMSLEKLKSAIKDEGINSIKGVLDKQYTNAIAKDDNAIVSAQEAYKQVGDYSKEVDYKLKINKLLNSSLSEGSYVALVYAKLNDKDFNVLIKVDGTNKRYSIFLGDYITKFNYNENMTKEQMNISSDEIESTGYNNYIEVDATDSYIVSEYFSDYKAKMLNDTQEAYNLLESNYRKNKYGDLNSFKDYIAKNKNSIEYASIKSYQANTYGNQKEYVCIDNNGKYYIFLEDSAQKYTVFLDTYTADYRTFLEKYNSASNEQKIAYNINKVFAAINDGDYKYVYNKLDSTFRSSNFKNEASFENYAKSTFFSNNTIKSDGYEVNGDVYIYNMIITNSNDDSKKVSKTIIMKLKEGTDFVMSFNVK